jgi:hypothetical protein
VVVCTWHAVGDVVLIEVKENTVKDRLVQKQTKKHGYKVQNFVLHLISLFLLQLPNTVYIHADRFDSISQIFPD